jgi:uncharacterized membrane protein
MALLILGLVLFLGAHSVQIVARDGRDRLVARFGAGPYKVAYSLVALLGLVLIVYGYAAAREAPVVLWDPPLAMRHVAGTLMLLAFPILFAAYLPGRIKAVLKHPMLVAVKVWALAHLLANGTLADLVLFGGVLAWAVADRISVKRRAVPVTVTGGSLRNDALAVGIGLAVWALFAFWLHEALFGVSPFA